MRALKVITIGLVVFLYSCDGASSEDPTYEEALETGIEHFTAAKYNKAISSFETAEGELEEEQGVGEISTWIGWTHFKLNNLEESIDAFEIALSDQDTVIVDLLAGTAFALNANKDYESSNLFIEDLYDEDDNWTFAFGLDLTTDHVILLSAQNYFNLGEFSSSYNAVRSIDSNFSADVSTPAGQASLADKIEALGGSL